MILIRGAQVTWDPIESKTDLANESFIKNLFGLFISP